MYRGVTRSVVFELDYHLAPLLDRVPFIKLVEISAGITSMEGGKLESEGFQGTRIFTLEPSVSS